uniref:Serpentine receptor class gamma n=1 Tax=Heligmosomoides polygyrus TaxID=6339 RepID=A0A183GV28_HELPZ
LATTLTSRFQFSENMTSSRLLITLSGIQLVIFLTYGISMMFLRTTQQKNGGPPSIYRSNVQAAYLVPVYTLLLPLITMLFLTKVKQTRRSDIQTMIKIKASGTEGWANYSSQLQQQWGA